MVGNFTNLEEETMKYPEKFDQVSVATKANVYFDGKVVSHSVWLNSGEKKTLGLIYPGKFHFNTDAAERMDILSGECRVLLKGSDAWKTYSQGESFEISAQSGFDIEVNEGIAEYICSFLK
jgi:uncharacterized protein YaiE (UPF0345 family)